MPADLSIRPLGLAEVIDRSVALAVRHFRALFLAMLAVEAPALALAHMHRAGAAELAAALDQPERAAALMGGMVRDLALLSLALLSLQLVATAAVAWVVAPSLDPRARTGGAPGRLRRIGAVASATALQVAVVAIAPLLGALPGAALAARARGVPTLVAGLAGAAVGGLGLLLLALLRLALAPVAAAVEGRGGWAALARSSRLMRARCGARLADHPGVRASLVLLATFVLAVAVTGVAGIPRLVALHVQGGPAGLALLSARLPLGLEIVLSLLEAAASAALQPFSLVAVAVLYFDRRARTEALDVELWAERLERGA